MKSRWLLLSLLVCLAGTPGRAQEEDETAIPDGLKTVHLDTPDRLPPGAWAGLLDLRLFGGKEEIVYTSLGLHYGLRNGWEALARGTFAEKKRRALPGGGFIRHGGSDVEIALKYRPEGESRWAALLGLAFPDTAAQNDPTLTLGFAAGTHVGNGRVALYLNPRAVFLDSNTLVGIGLGAQARLAERLTLVADWTPMVAGDNTRDLTTGARKSRDVWGIAARYTTADGRYSLEAGFANGLGITTGNSLTPGLGGDGTVYLAFTARR